MKREAFIMACSKRAEMRGGAAFLLALFLVACSSGGDDGDSPDATDAGDEDTAVGERDLPDTGVGDGDGDGDASTGAGGDTCAPTGAIEHEHTSEAPAHMTEPLPASSYNSSPPSNGSHCGTWGHYATYGRERPLPACNFLHNLEHGAIVLLYNCPDGCPEITDVLGGIVAAPPSDPDCITPRLALTPYEEMDAKVAAVAWGFTWTSDCLDAAARDSLESFIEAHIGTRGDSPEPTVCGNGSFAP